MANFDEIIDRKNSYSLKHDFARERGKPEGLIPLWVADMDFRAPDAVVDALTAASKAGIFGYTVPKPDYYEVVRGWFSERYDYVFRDEHVITTPGIVYALAMSVRAFTEEGDAVLIQRPVYHPFSEVIDDNRRKLVNSPLVQEPDGKFRMDFTDFERKVREENVKLFILCSPHNPVGRVWTRAELEQIGDICVKYGVVVVTDEIHCDFTYPGYKHTSFTTVKESFEDIAITCTAPSKTFNFAGLQISNIIIKNQQLRRKFRKELDKSGYSQPALMGIVACKAAYEYGGPWLEELRAYLKGNLDFLRAFLKERIPQIKMTEPEGTYLVWLDFRTVASSVEDADDLITNRAGLWLSEGSSYGPEGIGFQRINMACPRSVLRQALEQLAVAVADRG
ncbi:MAG: pyridoxal phosphate-dependent aminotransferase [Clostridiales Family XIII bacterium]|jgi:cystathionine beta-lyase|nr:pyridoxal phosphate-dependent aminotransferase [Clostridiales Family XIII bacterium]